MLIYRLLQVIDVVITNVCGGLVVGLVCDGVVWCVCCFLFGCCGLGL